MSRFTASVFRRIRELFEKRKENEETQGQLQKVKKIVEASKFPYVYVFLLVILVFFVVLFYSVGGVQSGSSALSKEELIEKRNEIETKYNGLLIDGAELTQKIENLKNAEDAENADNAAELKTWRRKQGIL
jgi:hypothetical protein